MGLDTTDIDAEDEEDYMGVGLIIEKLEKEKLKDPDVNLNLYEEAIDSDTNDDDERFTPDAIKKRSDKFKKKFKWHEELLKSFTNAETLDDAFKWMNKIDKIEQKHFRLRPEVIRLVEWKETYDPNNPTNYGVIQHEQLGPSVDLLEHARFDKEKQIIQGVGLDEDDEEEFNDMKEKDDILLEKLNAMDKEEEKTSLPESQKLSRSQPWDHNIAAKVAEFIATFEKVLACNIISCKRGPGEFRSKERLMIEQALLQEERQALIEMRAEIGSWQKAGREAHEANLRNAAIVHPGQAHENLTQTQITRPIQKVNPNRTIQELLADVERENQKVREERKRAGLDTVDIDVEDYEDYMGVGSIIEKLEKEKLKDTGANLNFYEEPTDSDTDDGNERFTLDAIKKRSDKFEKKFKRQEELPKNFTNAGNIL
ncbi:unnamed protein product [Ilex paraguariensis]|uniref:Uncharacterized protein n=1 Tax=Ilex paraguariensis TaxID=185542 RepID=A0ABC8TLY5_9AQUA